MVICCLVLCNVSDDWNNKILFNINNILREKGHLIISICNPFFDDISCTELRTKGYEGDYSNILSYKKKYYLGKKKNKKSIIIDRFCIMKIYFKEMDLKL